jgi:3-hydroxyisobutyrate dehydrogenase-like beta-hydroxyacid dehydrogenase
MKIAFTGLGGIGPHIVRNLLVNGLDAPVSSMAKASYGDAAGEMTPVRLYKTSPASPSAFPR